MSTVLPISEPITTSPLQHRVLACIRCQQRKIKCDKKLPSANCNKSRTKCVPSTLTTRGPRKRRFPERELLERLRKYEDLLRLNNIKFEPLHKDPAGEKESPNTQGGDESDDEQPGAVGPNWSSSSTPAMSERVYEAKYAPHSSRSNFKMINSIRNFLHSLNSAVRPCHVRFKLY